MDLEYARIQKDYLEHAGSATVYNARLFVALILSLIAVAGMLYYGHEVVMASLNRKPLVVRIDSIGHAETVNTDDYRPQAVEIRAALTQYVMAHYSRLRDTIMRSYPDSMFFVDSRLTDIMAAEGVTREWVGKFMSGTGDSVDVVVDNVSIEDLRHEPYRARIVFQKIFYSPNSHIESRREKWTSNIQFRVRPSSDPQMARVNPLGIVIEYFHDDQAFD